jgi:membrane associated rhomboid family serine protease
MPREGDRVIPLKDDVPTESPPLITVSLIAANVAAFVWQVAFEGLQRSILRGGLIPYELLTLRDVGAHDLVPPPFTILTSMFLHGGIAHVGGNMLFLWIFGNNVEDALGKVRFVVFYLASGVLAALAQTGVAAMTGDVQIPMVGASGAIAGVLAAYMVLFPRARVLTLIFVFFIIRLIYVPALLFIGLWFGLQLFSAIFGGSAGVAVFAHIGGFLAGFLLVKTLGRRPRWRARRVVW